MFGFERKKISFDIFLQNPKKKAYAGVDDAKMLVVKIQTSC